MMRKRTRVSVMVCMLGYTAVPVVARAQEPAPREPAKAPADAPAATTGLEARLEELVGRRGGLTSDEVARRAVATSPAVRAKQAQVAGAAAEVDRSIVAYFPRLTLTGRYTRLSPIDQPSLGELAPPGSPVAGLDFEFPVILNQYWLQANLVVPLSDYLLRIGQGRAAAEHSRRAASLSREAAARNASLQARTTYYSFVRARLQAEVAAQNVDQAKAHLETARAAFEGGRTPRADVLRAESRLATAELFLERANNLARLTEEQVRLIIRDPSSRRYEIGEDLAEPPRGREETTSLLALQAEALANRMEFRALDESARALSEQRKSARAGNYPRLDAFGNLYYANPNPRYIPQTEDWRATWDVGLQVTWSPNDVGMASAGVDGIEAKRAEIQAQRLELADNVRTEVLNAYQMVKEARVAVESTERALTAAEESYRVRSELYELGRSSFVELVDAQTDLLRARLELVNARIDLWLGKARLSHALGRDRGA